MKKARKKIALNLKIHTTKWVSGETATGTVMDQRKQKKHSNCPMCHETDETTRHILQCKSNAMQKLHVELLTELKKWMTKVQTRPEILQFICEGLQSWFKKGEYDIDHNMEPHIKMPVEHKLC